MKKLIELFLTMLKIGTFTFGGGYSMIAFLESELVEKKKWIERDDFLNMIAIAESTPGPVAINSATYIGYKMSGVLGSILCTLGVVLPAFIIMFIISLYFDQFLKLKYISCIEKYSTKEDMKVDVCSKCHPYWTGNLKQNTTGGRADKFKKKYGIQ